MEEEGARNFKELRARFQRIDIPPLPGPIVSRKGDQGCTQSTQILANGKYLSSKHNRPLSYCSNEESQPIKTQKVNLAQRNEIQKSLSISRPPLEKLPMHPARNSEKISVLLDADRARTETSIKEKGMAPNSFRYKLWNWEKVSSQKSEIPPALPLAKHENKTIHQKAQKIMGLSQEKPRKNLETRGVQTLLPQNYMVELRKSLVASEDSQSTLPQQGMESTESPGQERSLGSGPCQPIYDSEIPNPVAEQQHPQLPKTKPLPSIETLGPPPPKPSKPPAVNLQAFHREPAAIAETPKEVSVKMDHLPLDSAELEEPHDYEATISYLRNSGGSINLCATEEIADATYEVEIEELQKPWGTFLHQDLSPRHNDGENNRKEKEPLELEPDKDPYSNHPLKVGACARTPEKTSMTGVHEERSAASGSQEAVTDITQNTAFPEDGRLAKDPEDMGAYMEAVEVTKETPIQGPVCQTPPQRRPMMMWNAPRKIEENSEEMYEDIYKTKNNDQKLDLDGNTAFKKLQDFFKREKGMFKVKKSMSKEKESNGFSTSLPDLGLRTQEVIIYDDVGTNDKEPKDEDKLKTWKPKFLPPKFGKKEKKYADGAESFSPRNFFRTKKQNLEKNKMEKEEKLFRERFQYNKEITVINRAVACSRNSRNGTFDLPVTPGEQLEVIDTTEQNLVLCRNSKGKYGYVLIEHLHFKHQGWTR